MEATRLPIQGAVVLRCPRYTDNRGFFQELYHDEKYADVKAAMGEEWSGWKQVSWSTSGPYVLRGVHTSTYAKLVTCLSGSMIDCLVDLREDSPSFLRWCFVPISHEESTQVLIPAGCGHGFLTLEKGSQVMYLQAGTFDPPTEQDLTHCDARLAINWPLHLVPSTHNGGNGPTISAKDVAAPTLAARRPHLAPRLQLRLHAPRVLVIGASGQVGNALLSTFGRSNCVGTFSEHDVYPADVMIHFDLAAAAATPELAVRLLETTRPQYVCICAGWTWVDGCESDPAKAMAINAHGPAAVAAAAKRVGARTVYYSTEYVFDGSDANPGPYDEAATPAPLNAYGRSKLEGEKLIAAADDGALILRTTVVYGPERQGKNFVYQLARNVGSGKGMAIVDDQLSSPTYNRDLADITATLLTHGASGVYNVVGPETMGRDAFGMRVANALSLSTTTLSVCHTTPNPAKASRPLRAGLNIAKLLEFLGKQLPSETPLAAAALLADPSAAYGRLMAPRSVEDAVADWLEVPDEGAKLLGQ